ncbi:cytotoxic and regulatory T-cell molecule isoform X1 [Entelurus aequoreus]|uniref:cytotoxic and regulatory T-cell molecule isoform X1 n=2 Tax=Entelurus aequoreus TaxID=161455 RepID=UPI002B1E21B3|nr:cytotoxic and regulatory T-cell molecule isoform X1 [Entelurus aequoreus]
MEVKLKLGIFLALTHVSLAVWQRVTVMKGQTVRLACSISNAHKQHIDWKNPDGYSMFFNPNKALKDKRYSISKLTESQFAISISNVSFKDGGNYTCSQYGHHITEKKVELTVLGVPKMRVTKHDGMFVIQCTAEGNHFPPQISWKFDYGPEFLGNAQAKYKGKKYVSMDMVHLQSVNTRVAVKCIVRHPCLHLQPLMNFVKIGKYLPGSTTTKNLFIWNTTSTPGTVVTVCKDQNTSSSEGAYNNTSGNTTIMSNDPDTQTGHRQTSPLLVFLVACLILGLLAVVICFVLKLRRAHVTWEKENEISDPSEESGKSKSSQEEKVSRGHNRRGLFRTAFTQYSVEKATITSKGPVIEMAVEREEASSSSKPTSAKCDMQDTELSP